VQGFEWLPGGVLVKKMNEYGALQTCVYRDITCLLDWSRKTGQTFDYVIVRQNVVEFGAKPGSTPLAASLEKSATMKKVFESGGTLVFVLQNHELHCCFEKTMRFSRSNSKSKMEPSG
jgi:hypothetical protein